MSVTENVTRHAVIGALVSLWGVIRHQGDRVGCDLVVTSASPSIIDRIAELPGLSVAMKSVGWVDVRDNSVVFPGFFSENNSDPHDTKRQKSAERQRRHREKKQRDTECDMERYTKRDCHAPVTHREEKRREEKSIKDPLTPLQGEAAVAAGEEQDGSVSVDDAEFSSSAMAFVVTQWNAVDGTAKCRKLSKKLRGSLRTRMRDPFWMTHWQDALDELPKCKGLFGDNARGWVCNFEWFCRIDTVQNIVEGGKYGNSSPNATGRGHKATEVSGNGIVRKSGYVPAEPLPESQQKEPF